MKRGEPMQRRVRIGAASRRRIREGGALAKGRRSLSREGYQTLRQMIITGRAENRDEATLERLPFDVLTLDHVILRSATGADSWDNCYAASISTQRWRQEAYSGPRGRLLAEGHGDGTFTLRIARGSKQEPVFERTWTIGRPPTDEERERLEALR